MYNSKIEKESFLGGCKLIKHIFSDMDGTLLNSQGNVSDGNAQVIMASKIPFTLVSARAPMEMAGAIDKLQLTDAQIGFNGGLIYQKTATGLKVLKDDPLNNDSVAKLLTLIQTKFPKVSCSYYDLNHWYTEKIDTGIKYETKLTGQTATITNLNDLNDRVIYKIMLITFDLQEMLNLNQTLLDAGLTDVSIKRSGDNYLEITSQAAQKSKGIQYIKDLEKLQTDEMAAFGDGHNDLPMLTSVGLPIVMENALPEIKPYGKFITKTNDEDGVAYGIKTYLAIN